jgi:TM2 domain-containing membrane protein YozV
LQRAYNSLLFLILNLLTGFAAAQDVEQTFSLGKEQMVMKHYDAASLAFERVLFFGEGKYQSECLGYLGDMSMAQNETAKAIQYYGRASVASKEPALSTWFSLRKCSALLKQKETKLALIELLGQPNNLPDTLTRYKNFLLGITWFNEFDFEASRISFKEALQVDDIAEKNAVDSLFYALSKIKHPNPKTAKTLSIFFPGAGQFYAGDIKNGINSLLLTGAFLALGISTAIRYSLVDAFGSVLPWFQRYYMGGYNRAERIAEERLREKQNKIFKGLLLQFQ